MCTHDRRWDWSFSFALFKCFQSSQFPWSEKINLKLKQTQPARYLFMIYYLLGLRILRCKKNYELCVWLTNTYKKQETHHDLCTFAAGERTVSAWHYCKWLMNDGVYQCLHRSTTPCDQNLNLDFTTHEYIFIIFNLIAGVIF